MTWLKNNILLLSFSIILILSFFTSLNVKWGDERWHSLINHDANGYYAYLPAIFIYHDINFSFYDDIKDIRKENPNMNYDYREDFKGNHVNKYYVGTAVAQLPFFLIAHALSSPLAYENTGFSKIYYVFISIAALFYVMIGLWFLNKILLLYKVNPLIRALSILSLFFGTHLFYYAIFEPGMSHVYSFAFLTMLIYSGKKYFNKPNLKTAIVFALLLGLITLIRPVNFISILLIPFLAGSSHSLKNGVSFLMKPSRILFSLLVFLCVASIQLIIYKIQTDYFFVYSYSEEGFNFLDPHMIDILFSYKKGLFLYTPLCLIASVGIYFLFKQNRFEAYSLLFFFIILTYLLSSWWSWWYGGSFSSRVYIDYLSLFGLLLTLVFQNMYQSKYFKIFILLILFVVLFNQKQTYLYRVAYIHWVDMDKEKYWQSTYHPFQLWIAKALGKPVEEEPK